MRTGRSAATILAVAVVLACAGCGRGGDGAAAGSRTSLTGPPPTAVVTQVFTFQAFDDRGLLPNLVRASSTTGVCTGGSLELSGRADAWRCTADGRVLDPCFVAEGTTELACVPDPFTTQVTILDVPGPLPRGNRNDPAHPPWFLQLDDGSRCGAIAGDALPPAAAGSRTATYACAGGAEVVGDPDLSKPVWTAQVRSAGGGAPVTARVAVAWY
jgi:hypothetical protein